MPLVGVFDIHTDSYVFSYLIDASFIQVDRVFARDLSR
jgi:hypothetical protein